MDVLEVLWVAITASEKYQDSNLPLLKNLKAGRVFFRSHDRRWLGARKTRYFNTTRDGSLKGNNHII